MRWTELNVLLTNLQSLGLFQRYLKQGLVGLASHAS